MHVIHFAAECYPVAKVGGLADVLGALPKYQRQLGINTSVVLPFYDKTFVRTHYLERIYEGRIYQGGERLNYEVLKEKDDLLGFKLFLIRIPGLLDREEVYSYPDEQVQFLAFQHAGLDWLCNAKMLPDIIHCHDHHTGLIPFYMEHADQFDLLKGTPTIATVHNGQYQGWMDWKMAALLPAFDTWRWGLLDWNGLINPLAALIKCCWAYTTVSEGYLSELYQEANGLESLFLAEKDKAYGIVNGIDTELWNASTDSMLAYNFNLVSIAKGKKTNKEKLCSDYGLNPLLPLIVFIGRFALEKGADLLADSIRYSLAQHEGEVTFFILGSGDRSIESKLVELSENYSQHFGVHIGYNEELAHQVYASADYLLMPSRVEPCGLNQLYAMRYGTIPVVRATGGLKDTVKDINIYDGYGMLFDEASVEAVFGAIQQALSFWKATKKRELGTLRKKIMKLDFSWDKSAAKYIELYKKLIE
ncbi:glycogen/starch synthase [Olivibacter sp. SDN3]|uniref:glycogen synthase n=1 Tax=Olivibacter sp. SDN3 TaxID=2764720 RepID=UPI0016516D98|nr:glycogen/starch synthase [Olivibacter sp. SDN3]QNL49938.1 glycogen/starch synthase [Olivibacter sp. SDN3]